jgi:hypothetical protein
MANDVGRRDSGLCSGNVVQGYNGHERLSGLDLMANDVGRRDSGPCNGNVAQDCIGHERLSVDMMVNVVGQ